MFRESLPIAYDAPADLKKWPSLKNQRVTGKTPYLVYNGTLADCIRQLLAKPIRQISLYDIVTPRQPAFDGNVLSPGDAAEIAMRKDFPEGLSRIDWLRRAGKGAPAPCPPCPLDHSLLMGGHASLCPPYDSNPSSSHTENAGLP